MFFSFPLPLSLNQRCSLKGGAREKKAYGMPPREPLWNKWLACHDPVLRQKDPKAGKLYPLPTRALPMMGVLPILSKVERWIASGTKSGHLLFLIQQPYETNDSCNRITLSPDL